MKYDRKTSTSPTKAATIVPLAASTFPLSPPDVIHLIPPYTKNPIASITAMIKRSVIILDINGPIPSAPILQSKLKSNPPEASPHGSIEPSGTAANADGTSIRYEATESVRVDNFFISNMIV